MYDAGEKEKQNNSFFQQCMYIILELIALTIIHFVYKRQLKFCIGISHTHTTKCCVSSHANNMKIYGGVLL